MDSELAQVLATEERARLKEFVESLNSHRHIENKKVACFLCNVVVGEGNWTSHAAGARHSSNVPCFETTQRIITDICNFQSLVPRIERLTREGWRDACYATFARSLIKNRDGSRESKRVLVQMEDLDHLHLLELAAWKTVCTINAPASALKSFTSSVVWASEGWKTNKEAFHRSNEVVTIIRCVLPFLDQRPPDQQQLKRRRVS
ncbi:hypothetical protein ACA910_002993 [Epithemia clementina (nom. ined.)]